MHIDWFTVFAQALNFLVLMWLLKRFLYKPILDAIAVREKHIADQLAEALTKEAEAKKEHNSFQKKNGDFDTHKAKMLSDVTKEVEKTRDSLLDKAKDDADALTLKKLNALKKEEENLIDEIIKHTKREVFAISTKTLLDLADVNLEARMCDLFLTHLQKLKPTDKKILSVASSKPMIIISAFELSPAQKKKIKTIIEKILDTEIDNLKFKIEPFLISGIELLANGHKLAWSIKDYLTTLEQNSDEPAAKKAKKKELSDAKG